WVTAADQIDLLAKIGISLLLFVVGLKLDLRLVRTLGPLALATGLGQMLFSSLSGYLAARAFGMGSVATLYVAAALAFSSTIIVVKLLSDKREIDSLHGRTAVGVLIVQDIVVIAVMLSLTAFDSGGLELGPWESAATVLAKAAGLLAVLGIAMRYVLPALLHRIAASQELLVLFGIAWAVALAAGAEAMDFSKEVGAFLAGVSLASTAYREALGARLVSLRDFLLLFFFIDLGAGLDIGLFGAQAVAALVLSVLVLLGKPFIIMLILGALGYRSRTGFLTGLSLAQISEFSLILAALGVDLGHIDSETASVITLVGVITIALSTYLTLYAHPLYQRMGKWLTVFERHIPHPEDAEKTGAARPPDVILFGLGRYGGEIARRLRDRGWSLLCVDFDPSVVASGRAEGLNVRYGDAHDPELLAHLPLERAEWILSTAPERDVNLALLSALHLQGYRGNVALRAHDAADAEVLADEGADLVLAPLHDGAKEAVELLIARRSPDAGELR
ncbi:MAG: cation:proton antiporter, partial [bacterium]|nr:cation:proton antiporter [bacterium]